MTNKKPKSKHAKRGPKPKNGNVDEILLHLFNEDGITYGHAAEIAKCSNEYASKKFYEFGDKIEKNKLIYESWVDKNDKVRDRSLEGISRNVVQCDSTILEIKKRLEKAQEMQAAIIPKIIDRVENSDVGAVLKNVDFDVILGIVKAVSSDLNLWKNFGYYAETISNNLRAEIVLKAELQQQFDAIEIMPPASEILDREIERRIAEKQNLQQVTPAEQAQEIKRKK